MSNLFLYLFDMQKMVVTHVFVMSFLINIYYNYKLHLLLILSSNGLNLLQTDSLIMTHSSYCYSMANYPSFYV